ncbi:MAG: TIM barrel protein [Phycisphaerae bacterium]|nr:TIM barrel protein [Phycisphaerae bacterium]
MHRRDFLSHSVAGMVATGMMAERRVDAAAMNDAPTRQPGFRHSACRWCYGSMPLDELCKHAKDIGIASIELLGEAEWGTVQKFGLTCAVANGPTSIPQGFNRVENHDRCVKESERLLPLIKAAGIPSMIVFSGNRFDMSDAEGLAHCVGGLQRITPIAEANGVTIVMELLNSKIDHHDYMCDRTAWGVELCKAVGSDRFKLLYDIYHMQIMEGDVIRTIRAAAPHIGHYHTGGNPGRNEIDASQELCYPAIARAITDTGYTGFVGQEFIPRRDPITSLREAVRLCTVA